MMDKHSPKDDCCPICCGCAIIIAVIVGLGVGCVIWKSNTCWNGERLDIHSWQCKNINECDETPNICGVHTCIDTRTSYRCDCNYGYESFNGKRCYDIDECQSRLCQNAECINHHHGYTCECHRGYENIDSYRCRPVCSYEYDCGNRGECVSPNKCRCNPGYAGPESGCKEYTGDCGSCENGHCTGPNRCECNEGYESNYEETTCQPICSGDHSCGDRGKCVSPNVCECNAGYTGSESGCNEFTCGECANGHCKGPDECTCDDGYRWEDESCQNVNECKENTHNCTQACRDTLPGFECACHPGYKMNKNSKCVAICSGKQSCADRGECVSPNVCKCNSGYTGSESGCKELACGLCKNGRCTGPNICSCNDGYRNETETCQNIDECKENTHDCTQKCRDTSPGFECECYPGYKMNEDSVCKDVNECEEDSHNCEQLCNNTAPFFKCLCNEGYELMDDGISCKHIQSEQGGSHLGILIALLVLFFVIVIALVGLYVWRNRHCYKRFCGIIASWSKFFNRSKKLHGRDDDDDKTPFLVKLP